MSDTVLNDVYTELKANQRRAIDALLMGDNKDAAAAAAGVTRRTLDRWHYEPTFRAALNQGGDVAIKDAATRLKASLDTAVGVMRAVMDDKTAPTAVQLRAADMVATHALKLLEITDLLHRLEAIEERLANEN